MAQEPFRFRCPRGEHAGIVPDKLFCTVCGRFRDETDEDYNRQLDVRILSLGGVRVAPPDDYIAFKEVWVRTLTSIAEDPSEDSDDDGEEPVWN
jgi:hypothetical protein